VDAVSVSTPKPSTAMTATRIKHAFILAEELVRVSDGSRGQASVNKQGGIKCSLRGMVEVGLLSVRMHARQ
jgi:hypothetical protein